MTVLVDRWLALPPNLRGILWVGLSGILFALLNVFTLIPAQHLNPYVMAFLRYFFGALFLVPIVMRLGLYRSLHTRPVVPSLSVTVSPGIRGANSSERMPSRSRKAPG